MVKPPPAKRKQRDGEIRMDGGIGGIDRERRGQPLDRGRIVASLQRHVTEQLERIEVSRLAHQDLPAQGLGLWQLPTVNQPQGLLNLPERRVRLGGRVAHGCNARSSAKAAGGSPRTARSCIRSKAASRHPV